MNLNADSGTCGHLDLHVTRHGNDRITVPAPPDGAVLLVRREHDLVVTQLVGPAIIGDNAALAALVRHFAEQAEPSATLARLQAAPRRDDREGGG